MAAETVDKFKLELDMYLEVMEIEECMDIGRTFRYLEHGWVIVCMCPECCWWASCQGVLCVFTQTHAPSSGKKERKKKIRMKHNS